MHEESKRKSGSSKVFPSPSQSDQTRVAAEMSGSIYAKQEDTIKAYESRIKTLEKLLQDQYHAKGEVADKTEVDQLRQSLAEEKKTSESQKLQIQELLRENEKVLIFSILLMIIASIGKGCCREWRQDLVENESRNNQANAASNPFTF